LPHFILEHFWGYSLQANGDTKEYEVRHPSWKYWDAGNRRLTGNFGNFYGESLAPIFRNQPHSVFVSQGSDVSVFTGRSAGGDLVRHRYAMGA
jgi:uncharacterized protein